MKIKCGDILFALEDLFVEVGPGKVRSETELLYEVFPIKQMKDSDLYEYAEEPIWIPKTSIAEHYTVRDKEDFFHAWISLGFEPIPEKDFVRFRRFELHEHVPPSDSESLSSESESADSIRSHDSYSTIETISESDSFITLTETPQETTEQECHCELCESRQDTERWFRRAWCPTDPTEQAVKRLIENIEEKYT